MDAPGGGDLSWLDPISAVADAAVPLSGAATDHDALLELAEDARFVLLGEASHGMPRASRA